MGYEEALALATKLGYAESDPTADVEGYDAGRKVAIMASIAFNSNVTFSQVYTEGITHITAEDIRYAKEFGYVIKLIGMTRLTECFCRSSIRFQLSGIRSMRYLSTGKPATTRCLWGAAQDSCRQRAQ